MNLAWRQGCASVAVKLFGPGVGVRAAREGVGDTGAVVVRVVVRWAVGVGFQAAAVFASGGIVGVGPRPGR